MSNCAWVACVEVGTHPQVDAQNQIWTTLCEKHDKELREAIRGGVTTKILSAWVKAQGGAKKAAGRM